MRRLLILSTALLLLGFGSGCESTWEDPMGHRRAFEEIQKKFTKFIRWGAIDEASVFVAKEQRDDFLELAPELTDMRFTDYEIIDLEYGEDGTNATAMVRYTGYRLSLPIERSFRVTQEWSQDPEDGSWSVELDVAAIRTALGTGQP